VQSATDDDLSRKPPAKEALGKEGTVACSPEGLWLAAAEPSNQRGEKGTWKVGNGSDDGPPPSTGVVPVLLYVRAYFVLGTGRYGSTKGTKHQKLLKGTITLRNLVNCNTTKLLKVLGVPGILQQRQRHALDQLPRAPLGGLFHQSIDIRALRTPHK
jgi:hypothetical protein